MACETQEFVEQQFAEYIHAIGELDPHAAQDVFHNAFESFLGGEMISGPPPQPFFHVWQRLFTMLKGIILMKVRSQRENTVHTFEKDSGWTLWISNHLRPLSSRASQLVTLKSKLKAAKKRNKRPHIWEEIKTRIKTEHAASEIRRLAKVNPDNLALILNLLPHMVLDCLWLHKTSTPAMVWLRDDMTEHCTYVKERYMARTWIDQSNIACKLDQVRGWNGSKLPSELIQHILGFAKHDTEDMPIRAPRVSDPIELQRKLQEVTEQAGERSLEQTRSYLKRILDSISIP